MKQLITTESGRLSNSKLWSFIGCGIASFIVIWLTIGGKMTWEIFLAYLGTVGGFSQISKWLAYRYGVKTDVGSTSQVDSNAVTIKKCSNCPAPATKKATEEEQPGD